MKRILFALVAATALLGGGALIARRAAGTPPAAAPAVRYQCPMHPEIVSDHPGVCPICQMNLQRVDEATPASHRLLFYRHPMRPDVTSPTPAKDEMGMDYVPVYEDDVSATAAEVPGHAGFALSTERQQLIGVKTATVERRRLETTIRTVGKIAYDPALYQAIVEYREALRARREIGAHAMPEARTGSDVIVRGAAVRLRQQGLSDAQLDALAHDRRDPENLLLPGKSVWVYASVYEYEMDAIAPGQDMVVTAVSAPGRELHARVVGVDTILNPTTRTARVRALLDTPDGSLRPESFVHATIRVPLGEQVALPKDAVLDTGQHRIAFVVRDEGRFEPRAVTLGRAAGDWYEVLAGVAPGERVVTSANFLIDSESRFRAALSAFGGDAHR